jgi:hypothetical protein
MWRWAELNRRAKNDPIYDSTCVECSLVLNNVAREHSKHYNTELLIVEILFKRYRIRNPIDYAQTIYRMSIEWTLP